jgi:hypothetical protein
MPNDRTKQLVYELDSWYRSHTLRQKDLAAALGLTAQALSEILSLRNRPGSEATLRIVEFLEIENMKPHLVDPPAVPRETNVEPKTLGSAKEMLAELRAEIAQLKATTPSEAPKMIVPPAPRLPTVTVPKELPATKPTAPPVFSQGDISTWNGKPPAATEFPPGCDSPQQIHAYLQTLSTESLRAHLNSSGATTDTKRLQQRLVFNELKARK